MIKPVGKDVVNYHVAVCSASYYESIWDSLHTMLSREQLGKLHCLAKENVKKDLEKANRFYD